MSEDKDRVACLKKKRSFLRTGVTNTVTRLEHELLETERIDVNKLEEILEILVTKFESLKCIDNELEPLFGKIEFEEEYTKTEEYNDKVTLTKFRVNKRIRELNKNVENFPENVSQEVEKINQIYQSNINIEENSVRIKLPKLCIPKFYGDVNQWLDFWNSFESAIYKNVHLNKVDKFNYLKSYLGGTALSTVDGFSVSDSTYDAAINLLKERFAGEDLLIQTNMSNILNSKPLKHSNDINAFRKFYDKVPMELRSLECLGLCNENISSVLCTTILKALPQDLLIKFNVTK
ncbi:DUF1758 domain-containing protein [Trichonephila clavata]|uniref:DUF1758 domain-containing protein n=1 Tax=Trichonephila clavata TaxID=2740835 RepID=A0A8X6LBK7_TRICU|nr:DUF1758 domain-containing protein [Trichonephila clavata]